VNAGVDAQDKDASSTRDNHRIEAFDPTTTPSFMEVNGNLGPSKSNAHMLL
jgi:hypothetical protein